MLLKKTEPLLGVILLTEYHASSIGGTHKVSAGE